jgi:hypothetical protein
MDRYGLLHRIPRPPTPPATVNTSVDGYFPPGSSGRPSISNEARVSEDIKSERAPVHA